MNASLEAVVNLLVLQHPVLLVIAANKPALQLELEALAGGKGFQNHMHISS